MQVTPETMYLIWSNEHRMWWGANSRGYTDLIEYAGRYTKEDALKICNQANYSWDCDVNSLPSELPICEEMAVELQREIYS